MPSPKRQAEICHKIAALSFLLSESLDELNPHVKDSNPFKKQCDAMAERCQEIVADLFGVEELSKGTYLQSLATKVDDVICHNFVRIPGE